MKSIKQILDAKGHDVWTIGPEDPVFDAIKQMAQKEVGALLVTDEQGKFVGIITERDYARKVVLAGKSSKQVPVKQIMTANVLCVRPDQPSEEAMALMTEKRTRHLPVLDGDRLVGIISIGDLVKAIIAEQQFIIEQLENYITS